MKNLEYYLAQARRLEEHREAGVEKEIRKLYQGMQKDLQTFMSDTYIRFAEEDKLDFGILQKAGYDARFLEEIESRINVASPKAAKELNKLVEETYEASFKGMIDGVQKSGGDRLLLDEAFAESIAITPETIRAAVQNPVSGLTLKDTLEKNRKEIIYSIKKTVGVGLMNGDRYTDMAKRIAVCVEGDYKKAIRVARTETHRVREAGNFDAAAEVDGMLKNGVTGNRMVKVWKSMKDEKVRPQRRRKGKKGWKTTIRGTANHMKMNGQTVLADENFDLGGGVKAKAPGQSGNAADDINCRCYASYDMMNAEEYFAATGKTWEKPLNMQAEDVILQTRNELYRHKGYTHRKISTEGHSVITDAEYNKIIASPVRRGANVIRGDPFHEKRLLKYNATASTIGDTIYFRSDCTISDVLEETYHFEQSRKGMNNDEESLLRTILNEIDAQEHLLLISDKYHISEEEIRITKTNLEAYREELKNYYRKK